MGLGAGQWIEAVQRLIEDQDARTMRDRLRQFDALPHAFAVACDAARRCFAQADAVDGFPCQALRVFRAIAEKPQIAFDEFVAGEAAREGVVLGRIADHAGRSALRSSGSMPQTVTRPREGRRRPAIMFISVVLPDPLGPTRLVTPGGIVRFTRLTPRISA